MKVCAGKKLKLEDHDSLNTDAYSRERFNILSELAFFTGNKLIDGNERCAVNSCVPPDICPDILNTGSNNLFCQTVRSLLCCLDLIVHV